MTQQDPAAKAVDFLGHELTQLRLRGFPNLDHPHGSQRHLSLPILDQLTNGYLGDDKPHGRARRLYKYLKASVHDFEVAENAADAELIKLLLFGPEESPRGKLTQAQIRDAARKQTDLSDRSFRRLQHGLFELFAEFLLDQQPDLQIELEQDSLVEPEPETSRHITEAC